MKFAWRGNLTDLAAWNSEQIEEVDEYSEMLGEDESAAEFDRLEDEFVLEDEFEIDT
jgi:hypothetical protein